ncbi:MAG TPA: aminoglycoside phosphotransferase family protein [Chloroflexota bacterium]
MIPHKPNMQDAAALMRRELGLEPTSVARFPTGLTNYVFEVRFQDHPPLVVRLSRPGAGENFVSAVYWHHRLTAHGIPLPRLLRHDTEPSDGDLPYMIVSRIPGDDLDAIYPALTREEKRMIAASLIDVQARAGRLPLASGFGFARSYGAGFAQALENGGLHPSWMHFLKAELHRKQERIVHCGQVDPRSADRVLATLDRYRSYCERIQPRCFLDDTALKNVIVEDGKLSGIVDVDWVCFGDPLLPVGLTAARLLRRGWDTDYVSYLSDGLALTPEQRDVLALYTAFWLVNSLALVGRTLALRGGPEPIARSARPIAHGHARPQHDDGTPRSDQNCSLPAAGNEPRAWLRRRKPGSQ